MDLPDSLSRRSYVAALGVVLAGCSGDDGDTPTDTPPETTAAPTDAPTTGRTPTGSATATNSATPTGSATATNSATPTGSATATDPGTPTPTRTESPTPTSTPAPLPFETPPGLPAATRDTSPIDTNGPSVSLDPVATGLTQPIALEPLPGTGDGGAGTRYVADKTGEIYAHDADGLGAEVLGPPDDLVGGGEQGLIGLAPHPGFASNRRYFVRYSAERRDGTPSNYSHTSVLAEYTATEDFRGTVEGSGRTILEVPQPQGNHNAGAITFGPDGYLYVAFGDGGGANDQGTGHVDDWYDAVGGGNGQDITENLLGSILRIDVDDEANGNNYAIPEDNPLVGEEGFDEQYAWGFRNPWRISFYRDVLFAADVGQNAFEEVSIVVGGGNHGWNVKEGVACFQAEDCPDESPRGNPLIEPVMAYSHDTGNSVIGGYFYVGDDVPALQNRYVFADYSGKLFAATPPGEGTRLWSMSVLSADFDGTPLAFGRGLDDELYLLTTGTVYRIGAA